MPSGFRVLRSTADLHTFLPEWRRLWRADAHATPFQSPAWLLPWWRQFGTDDLRALVLLRDDCPLAFVPLYVYREPRSGERQLLLLGAGTSDYLDGVFAPECALDPLATALEHLLAEPGWNTLTLPQLRPESSLLAALERTGAPLERFAADPCSRMRAVPLSGLPVKIRRNAMYYRNRAARSAPLSWHTSGPQDCQRDFDDFVRLHSERWQQRGEPGVLADERVLACHREALPLLLEAGLLRLCSLRRDGETLASMYALVDPAATAERTLYIYLTAFSQAHADLRPGTLLLAEAIDRAAAEGIHTIDMLRGDESYKKLWQVERRATAAVHLSAAALAASASQPAA